MTKKKILVVDDEKLILRTLCDDLEISGYDVTPAKNGEEALVKLKNECYDLVLTDLVMEEVDGVQVLNEAKRIDPEIAVIIITGYSNSPLAEDAKCFGADDFLLKPCCIEDLLERMAQCLEKGIDSGK